MKGPVTASRRDLHTLAGIVSEDRGEPPVDGVAPSLLGDLLGLIRCDRVLFEGHDSSKQLDCRRHPLPTLTARQQQVLHLVAAGYTNAQIARRLGISEGTVRTHLEHIYRLLQVSSRAAAVTRAFAARS